MSESSTDGTSSDEGAPPVATVPSTHDSEDGDAPGGGADVVARGTTVGRYLVLERVGVGAIGVVFAAYDPELDRKVAIKVLRATKGKGDPSKRQARLVREAKAMARLSHANVGAIHDVGVHEGQVFMALEYLPGGTLRDWLAAEKRPWREIVRMFIEVGQGLAAAHAEGLIHRDFKPDNVLLDKVGNPKVVDFGLVRLSAALEMSSTRSNGELYVEPALAETQIPTSTSVGAAALTKTGALAGTPAYMAPEQFLGEAVDERTDQFAYCVALYEGLYGKRPFAGDTAITLAAAVTDGRVQEAPKDAKVPAWVRRILLRGLAVDPSKRFSSMAALAAALANDSAKRTKKWLLAGGTLATIASLLVVATRPGSSPRKMCAGAGQRLASIWEPGAGSSQRKVAIRDAFAGSGKSYAAQTYASVARLFDQYVERWTGMYTDACEATHVRGEQSAQVLDLRMACLNERLGNARALSDLFASADGKVVENAVSAAASLPSLDRCADVALLRAVVKPPEDPAARKRVEDLRAELAQLVALRDSGQCARATPKADALIADVRALGYQPLLADTVFASAQLGSHCGGDAQMLQRFKEAYAAASASHNDEVAAQAAANIPLFAINRLGQVVMAQEWLAVAQAAVARLGRETLATAILASAEGNVALANHDYARALEAADRSIVVRRRFLGPDDPLTIDSEMNKGDLQAAAGRLDEALQTDIAAREHFERVLGGEHPRVAMVWHNEGEVLDLLGRHAEAEVAYEQSIQLFRRSGTDEDLLAWSLTGLGRARLGKQRPSTAVAPLEEALAIRVGKHGSTAQLGETRFALARALWSRPQARQRALALAASAREDYRDDKKRMNEIEAWLAEARAESPSDRTRRRLSPSR